MEIVEESKIVKVQTQGGTRVLTIGKLIPADWAVVRIKVINVDDRDGVVVRIEKVD